MLWLLLVLILILICLYASLLHFYVIRQMEIVVSNGKRSIQLNEIGHSVITFLYRRAGRGHQPDKCHSNAESDYSAISSMPFRISLITVTVLLADTTQAHGLIAGEKEAQLPVILGGLLLVALWLAYCIGALRVPPATSRWLVFHGASLIAALVTFSPSGSWIENGSAMHMIQHMLIMVVVAPLWVLARPLPQWLAASGQMFIRLWKPLLRLSRYPAWTTCLLGVAIWFWHAPKFYNLALTNPWWHFIEHICLALAAGVFWWSVLARRVAMALPALLFTFIHTSMLGALLTFSQMPFYSDARDLQDQQLAGLIMWIPGALPFLFAGIWCSLRLLSRAN